MPPKSARRSSWTDGTKTETHGYRGDRWERAWTEVDGVRTTYLYDGDNVYHRDGIGSVRGLTNSSQTLVNKYAYTAFGEPHAAGTTVGVEQRYTFQGREAGLAGAPMFYRNRQFDPATGRFLQRDPVMGGDPLFNPYCFPGNDPVSGTDPTGKKLVIAGQDWSWKRLEEVLMELGVRCVGSGSCCGGVS